MAWIKENDVGRELGRLGSENHREDDVTQAIKEATATAEGYLRGIVSDTELATWDTDTDVPTDVILQVSRIAASLILNRFYGQPFRRRQGDSASRAADLNDLALKELGRYAKGEKRLLDPATDDQIAIGSTIQRTGTGTTRKFDVGTDSAQKKLDRF